MPTSTRRLVFGFLSGAALLAFAACDPCAQEPVLCMPGAPGGWATGGEDAGGEGSGEDDGETGGEDADAPMDDDGGTAAAAAGESDGGQRGGEGGGDGGESGGNDDAGGSESGGSDGAGGGDGAGGSDDAGGSESGESGDPLLCWARLDACLEGGYAEQACLVDLRVCMVAAGVETPDGDCLGSITECLRDGGGAVACLDKNSACLEQSLGDAP